MEADADANAGGIAIAQSEGALKIDNKYQNKIL